MSTKLTKLIIFIFMYTIGLTSAMAQGPPPPGDPEPLPIDSNIYLLMVAGILFGLYVFINKASWNAIKILHTAEKLIITVMTKIMVAFKYDFRIIKKVFFVVLSFISVNAYSQIYFSANSSMYVKNEVLFVKQDVNLQASATLYLRNQAQLIQETTGASANSGTGIVSVFQEGTSDNFDYNYWCSPIGVPTAVAGNNDFGITALYQPTSNTAATAATILPVATKDGTASPLAIASRWIYKLTNANNYSQWVYVGNATTIAPGEGFTMKGSSGTDNTDVEGNGVQNNPGGNGSQRYDFRGKPNDGNITVTLGTNNTTLTGNPYPSALDLKAFLVDAGNTAGTGIAYFWEQDKTVNSHFIAAYKGGYGSYAPNASTNGIYTAATFNSYNGDGSLNTNGASSGLVIERRYSPIGQGFTLNGASNGSVTLKNSHRVYYKENSPLSTFARPVNDKSLLKNQSQNDSYFKLNVILNNQYTRQLALAFVDEATDGVDRGIDALSMDTNLPNDTYFFIENGYYVIQGVKFDKSKKIPLGVRAANNISLKFYIPEVTNMEQSQVIYLYDSLDNSYHNIKNEMYEVAVLKGIYNDRFKITFVKEKSLVPEESTSSNVIISQNNSDQLLIIQNNSDQLPTIINNSDQLPTIINNSDQLPTIINDSDELSTMQNNLNQLLTIKNNKELELKSIALYDMSGKLILSKENFGNSNNYSFSTSALASGIYIVKVTTANDKITTQKIIIYKSVK